MRTPSLSYQLNYCNQIRLERTLSLLSEASAARASNPPLINFQPVALLRSELKDLVFMYDKVSSPK